MTEEMIKFTSGATRSAETPFDPEGFLSPVALTAYCAYMARHRVQADGKMRDSDNWQRGMPTSRAWRSLTRHFFDAWLIKRGAKPHSADCTGVEDALCAIIFNALLLLKNHVENTHHEGEMAEPATTQDGGGMCMCEHIWALHLKTGGCGVCNCPCFEDKEAL